MNFISIDVETANADVSSICQIGLVEYKNSELVDEWSVLIDPEEDFDFINIMIHGIDEDDVEGAPTFKEVYPQLFDRVADKAVLCHTSFDRTSITRAAHKYGQNVPNCFWLDTSRVARRTWEQFAWSGYGLKNLCNYLNYSFEHHDALEDAKAAAFIFIQACAVSGFDIDAWFERLKKPIDLENSGPITKQGNPEGDYFGEVMVFTGSLEVPRREAAEIAAGAGFKVATNVNSKTTILVVGDQDIRRLAGSAKSTKHRKAEQLIREGQSIRILQESDFKMLFSKK